MRKKSKRLTMQGLTVLGGIIGICSLFFFYNTFLLDKTLANLKISLRQLEGTEDLEQARAIKGILEDAFIAEIASDDFDIGAAAKVELTAQLMGDVPAQRGRGGIKYFFSLDSATKLELASNIVGEATEAAQLGDARYFINDIVKEKDKERAAILSKIDDIFINISPQTRKISSRELRAKVRHLKKGFSRYQGQALQEQYVSVVKTLLRLRDFDEALTYIDKTLAINEETQEALSAQFYRGIIYKLRGDFAKASQTFRGMKEKASDKLKTFATYQEADSVYRMGDVKEAILLFEEVFQGQPKSQISQIAQFRAGYTYLYDLGDEEKSREAFEQLVEVSPTSEIVPYVNQKIVPDIAWQYRKQGIDFILQGKKEGNRERYVEALGAFDQALRIDEKDALAHSGKAIAYYFLQNREAMSQEIKKARKLAPDDPEVLAQLGFLYYNIGIIERALLEYERAVRNAPESYILNYNLGTLYLMRGNLSRAKQYLRAAIERNQEFAYAYNNLGYILWQEGAYQEAELSLAKAVLLDGSYIDARYNYAVVLYVLGRYEDSRKGFLRVQENEPNYRKTRWYLKDLKKRLGY